MPKKSKSRSKQKGGASTDYGAMFHSPYVPNPILTSTTLKNIDKAPMFNPLQKSTVFPTGSTGVVPTGLYLGQIGKGKKKKSHTPKKKSHTPKKTGGAKRKKNPWIAHVQKFAKDNKIGYLQALQHKNVKSGYVKVNA